MQVVDQVIRLVRQIAQTEVMPRFLRVRVFPQAGWHAVYRSRSRQPGSTEPDLAGHPALSGTR